MVYPELPGGRLALLHSTSYGINSENRGISEIVQSRGTLVCYNVIYVSILRVLHNTCIISAFNDHGEWGRSNWLFLKLFTAYHLRLSVNQTILQSNFEDIF